MKISIYTIAFVSVFLCISSANAAPVLFNGSLTGPIDNAGLPPGWTAINPSPDTMDENNNVGFNQNTFQATPSPSPDGGTWVGMATDGISIFESFGQTVNGFSIGTTYDVSWYHANFGHGFGFDGANTVVLLIDGIVFGSGASLGLGISWVDETVSFTATSLSHQIGFQLQDITQAYHSIDGIRLEERTTAPVPLPAGLGLFILALATLQVRKEKPGTDHGF